MPSSSSSVEELAHVLVVVDHHVVVLGSASARTGRRLSGLAWVRKCMWVVLNQTKKGVPAWCCARDEIRWPRPGTPRRTVSMRFLVSGPVFSIFWPPLPSAQQWSTPRGPNLLLELGKVLGRGIVAAAPAPPRR